MNHVTKHQLRKIHKVRLEKVLDMELFLKIWRMNPSMEVGIVSHVYYPKSNPTLICYEIILEINQVKISSHVIFKNVDTKKTSIEENRLRDYLLTENIFLSLNFKEKLTEMLKNEPKYEGGIKVSSKNRVYVPAELLSPFYSGKVLSHSE